MKYLIAGRTGTGKDALARILTEKHNMKQLKSYSTRPKRTPDEDSHIFITEDDALSYTNRAAETVINGYTYFATVEQVRECDIYVIDPIGIESLVSSMPDEIFHIVYLQAENDTVRTQFALRRASDPFKESAVFAARCAAENTQFSEFENALYQTRILPGNIRVFHTLINKFTPECLEEYADMLAEYKQIYDGILRMLNRCVEYKKIPLNDDGKIEVTYPEKTIFCSKEEFADIVFSNDDTLNILTKAYLLTDPVF